MIGWREEKNLFCQQIVGNEVMRTNNQDLEFRFWAFVFVRSHKMFLPFTATTHYEKGPNPSTTIETNSNLSATEQPAHNTSFHAKMKKKKKKMVATATKPEDKKKTLKINKRK